MTTKDHMLQLLKLEDKWAMRKELYQCEDLEELRDAVEFAKLLAEKSPVLFDAAREVLALKILRGNQPDLEI